MRVRAWQGRHSHRRSGRGRVQVYNTESCCGGGWWVGGDWSQLPLTSHSILSAIMFIVQEIPYKWQWLWNFPKDKNYLTRPSLTTCHPFNWSSITHSLPVARRLSGRLQIRTNLKEALVISRGFLGGSDSEESACNAGDLDLIPGSGKIRPRRRKWQPTPVSLTGEFYGQRSLVGSSPWGCKRRMQLSD